MIISAYFFVGRMKSSKAGLTNFEYCRQGVAFNDKISKIVDKSVHNRYSNLGINEQNKSILDEEGVNVVRCNWGEVAIEEAV
jgi:hypothetical protein